METFKEKWTAWPFFRQLMLVATVGAMLLATVLYLIVGSQKGVWYGGFYTLTTKNGVKTYTNIAHEWHEGNTTIQSAEGRRTVYTVAETPEGYQVECRVGEESFGPYQVRALDLADLSTRVLGLYPDGGMEITNATTGERLFRGGYIRSNNVYAFLLDENKQGEASSIGDFAPPRPEKGPSCDDLYRFTFGGAEGVTTSRVNWSYFALALLMAVLNAASILWAEELFVWSMSFRVADPEKAKPSEWELFTRHAGWAVWLLLEVILLLAGLLSGT